MNRVARPSLKPRLQAKACSTALIALLLSACMVGPNYKQPSAAAPPAFKETPPVNFKEAEAQGWKQAQPGDAYEKGRWWEIYGDPALNALEQQVNVSNQNVLQAEAQYRQAKAAITQARSALFPTLGTAPGITESRAGAGNFVATANTVSAAPSTGSSSVRTSLNLPFDISWEPDLWGSVRRNVTASRVTAQALAADVSNAELLYQAQLAEDYFGLHGIDAEANLLGRTESSYQEYLSLTKARFSGGIASDLDVAQAESQLYGVQAQLVDLGVQRAQYEHAIAILIGKAPAEITIPSAPLNIEPPPVPVGVPSELLERRPDIASAERRVAAANEQIGIAMAAFYPSLSLTGSAGFAGPSFAQWLIWPARFWSVGAQLAETLFDAGRRRSIVEQERAAYDATVAGYRQTVLTAFQQVEDNLAALRIEDQETAKIDATIEAAQRTLTVSTAQYRAGTATYLTVIASQATLLDAQRTAVTLLTRRMTASVLLVEALGGGWKTAELPHA